MRTLARISPVLPLVALLACGGHDAPPAGRIVLSPDALTLPAGSTARARACYAFDGAGDPGFIADWPAGLPAGMTVDGTRHIPRPGEPIGAAGCGSDWPTGVPMTDAIDLTVATTAATAPGTYTVRVRLANADSPSKDLSITVIAP